LKENKCWKGYGRKQSCRNLNYYSSTCLEGLRKTTKNLTVSHNNRFLGRDLNPGPPIYEPLDHDVRYFHVITETVQPDPRALMLVKQTCCFCLSIRLPHTLFVLKGTAQCYGGGTPFRRLLGSDTVQTVTNVSEGRIVIFYPEDEGKPNKMPNFTKVVRVPNKSRFMMSVGGEWR
jgi:hypothetical protein